MNPEAILALISDLTTQVHAQAARINELEQAEADRNVAVNPVQTNTK